MKILFNNMVPRRNIYETKENYAKRMRKSIKKIKGIYLAPQAGIIINEN